MESVLKMLIWAADDFAKRRQRDPAKLAIAARLLRETTLTLKVIAVCLRLECPNNGNARLRKRRPTETAEGERHLFAPGYRAEEEPRA